MISTVTLPPMGTKRAVWGLQMSRVHFMVIPRTKCPRIILQLEKHISASDALPVTVSLVPAAGPGHRCTYYNGCDLNLWEYLDRSHLGEDKSNTESEERGGTVGKSSQEPRVSDTDSHDDAGLWSFSHALPFTCRHLHHRLGSFSAAASHRPSTVVYAVDKT